VHRRGVILILELRNNKNTAGVSCSPVRFSVGYPLFVLVFFSLLSSTVLAEESTGEFKPVKTGGAWVYSVASEFDDVKDSLMDAIESEGMVISYVSHAEVMLARTASTLGARAIYSDAEVLLFCKANLAHRLVEANPHNLVLCPYAISVYVLAEEPARVYVGIRAPQANVDEYKAVHALLEGVIAEALAEQ